MKPRGMFQSTTWCFQVWPPPTWERLPPKPLLLTSRGLGPSYFFDLRGTPSSSASSRCSAGPNQSFCFNKKKKTKLQQEINVQKMGTFRCPNV